MLRMLKKGAMVAGFIGMSYAGLASPCHAEGVGGQVEAVWRNRPVDADAPDIRTAAMNDTAPSNSDSPRQENGCPQSSGLSPKKWVCLTLPESREVDNRLIDLESLLAAERAKRPRHLGLSLSCSVGAAVSLDGSAGLVPPSCGIYYGFAWRLGK
jgi:hypothetical protein